MTFDIPVPGIPVVLVTLPFEFTDILAPFTPALIPTLFLLMLSFTPGAIFILFLNLSPIYHPPFLFDLIKFI